MKKHGKILLALLLILGISVFAGGCGKDEDSSDGQKTEGTDGDTVTITPLQVVKSLLELPRI